MKGTVSLTIIRPSIWGDNVNFLLISMGLKNVKLNACMGFFPSS